MTLEVEFQMDPMTLQAEMGEIYDVGDERLKLAREEGYADGYAAGELAGYETGYEAVAEQIDTTNEVLQRSVSGTYRNDKLTAVGAYAFYYCSNLVVLDLPAVSFIGEYAFAYCKNLAALYLRNPDKVCTLYSKSALSQTNIARIYVPAALVTQYRSATNWSSYASKISPIAGG